MMNSSKKRRAEVAGICEKFQALKDIVTEYPWFQSLLEELVMARLARNRPVYSKLDCVTDNEARKMGASLSPNLRVRSTSQPMTRTTPAPRR
jgi:hypothetical protein